MVRATVEGANGRAPVMAGVWALRVEEAADLARHAEDAGAQGVFLPTPIYYPADDRAIFQWYDAIHKATSLPVFAYNIPQYAANTISHGLPETDVRGGRYRGREGFVGQNGARHRHRYTRSARSMSCSPPATVSQRKAAKSAQTASFPPSAT